MAIGQRQALSGLVLIYFESTFRLRTRFSSYIESNAQGCTHFFGCYLGVRFCVII